MTAHQLSPLDVAFLCLEDGRNPMHLGAVATFSPHQPVHPARIVALLCERAQEISQLRKRTRASWLPPGGASWVDDPRFAVEDHVTGHHLRPHGGEDRFAELVSALMAQPLDLGRPPWELHVVTGLAGGRFAVVVKLHHALCDGTKAVGLGLRLLDDLGRDVPVARESEPGPVGLATTVVDSLRELASTATIASAVLRSARTPGTRSPVLTRSARPRQVVMARLGLDEVQRVRKRHGGTVNDVLLALVTGALRQWLVAHDSAGEGATVRALIPVSRRGRDPRGGGGNQISGFLCDLPVGEPDARRRLRAVRADMDRNKAVGPDRGAGALPLLADRIPAAVHRLATPLAGRCAPLLFDALVTSVHLPALPLRMDGADLREVYPVAPVAAGHAVGVALSVYRGGVHVCLHTNQPWMSGSRWLLGALRRELAALDHAEARVDGA
ncbi:wax ester/triacylglycerol synthase family O-acyltransferase [Umezawaea sp.]|uniref:wax ester/triacylglycerol synthase family O-acyltransferase n=1 Tax=Umezawaea sp. TaxID=1955258 RepID=UPI002ED03E9B